MLLLPSLPTLWASALALQMVVPLPPGQNGQPRDSRPAVPEATGTAIVRGRVVTGDGGQPVKHVGVVLVPSGSPDQDTAGLNRPSVRISPHSVVTDDEGRFEFTQLPAGFYRLSARPGAYQAQFLAGSYGQTRTDTLGLPFELTDGQVLANANILLPRGGVITGRLTDDDNEPIARASLYVLFFAPGSTNPSRTGGQAQTDDLGRFRLFGLQAGDYLLVADVRGGLGGPMAENDPTGFMPTYYPGVAAPADAQRIRVRAGAEASGLDFRLIRGRLFTVHGTVIDSQGRPLAGANAMVTRATGPANAFVNGFSINPQGEFTIRSLPPGDYKVMIRPRFAPQGMLVMNGRQMPDQPEFASVDLHVDADVNDLLITTRPTLTIAGRVAFAEALPTAAPGEPDPVHQIRVSAGPPPSEGMSFGPSAPAQVGADLTFTLKGLSSAAIVRVSGLPRGFIVKQVLVGSEDITDRAHEFVDRDSGQLQVIVTSRAAGLEGNVTDAAGKPAVDAIVAILPDTPEARRSAGPAYRMGVVDPRGHFRITGVRPGQFVVIAITRDRMPRMPYDSDALEALAKDAQPLTLGDGELRVLDLKLSPGATGGD